jgi:proteic killer suppression protein
MAEMPNTSEILLARLAEGLDSTAKMTQALLSDLRESEADFAAMKTELNILKENVKGLAELVRDGGTSSILTKVALIEQSIDTIKKWMDNHVDVHGRMTFQSKKFEKVCQCAAKAKQDYGTRCGTVLLLRLQQLSAAPRLEDMRNMPGRCHELKGNLAGMLSLDLEHPYRLLFKPEEEPPPLKDDGGLDWTKVEGVLICRVEDTHG